MNVNQINPEVERAQRQAELKDMMEWRGRRLAAYKAWSQPEAVAERKAKHEAEAAAALELGQQMAIVAKQQMLDKKLDEEMRKLDLGPKQIASEAMSKIKITRVIKPSAAKIPWWRRMLNRLWR